MSKYSPEVLEVTGRLAGKGCNNAQIITALGITPKTFYEWLNNEPEFKEAIRLNRKVVCQKVEPKLLKRANGFSYTEKTVEYGYNKQGEWVVVSEKRVKKQVPPDVAALKYVLNNWDPENWTEKQSVEHQLPDGYGVIVLPGKKSVEDWEDEAQSYDEGES